MQNMTHTLSTESRVLIQRSWAKVVPIADLAADLFYEKLFARNPDIAGLFERTDMNSQKNKLIHALSGVIASIEQLDNILPLLADLGQRHTGYGVEPVHYDDVGHALIETLETGLGEHWNNALKSAWCELYGIVSRIMQGDYNSSLQRTA